MQGLVSGLEPGILVGNATEQNVDDGTGYSVFPSVLPDCRLTVYHGFWPGYKTGFPHALWEACKHQQAVSFEGTASILPLFFKIVKWKILLILRQTGL